MECKIDRILDIATYSIIAITAARGHVFRFANHARYGRTQKWQSFHHSMEYQTQIVVDPHRQPYRSPSSSPSPGQTAHARHDVAVGVYQRLRRHNGEIVCPRCLPLQENRQRGSAVRSSAFYWGEGEFKSLLNGFSGPIGRSENVIKCAFPKGSASSISCA